MLREVQNNFESKQFLDCRSGSKTLTRDNWVETRMFRDMGQKTVEDSELCKNSEPSVLPIGTSEFVSSLK